MQMDDFDDNDEMDMSDDERDLLPKSNKRVKLDNQSLQVCKQHVILKSAVGMFGVMGEGNKGQGDFIFMFVVVW